MYLFTNLHKLKNRPCTSTFNGHKESYTSQLRVFMYIVYPISTWIEFNPKLARYLKKKSDSNHFIVKCAAWKGINHRNFGRYMIKILPLQYKQVGIVLKLIIYLKSFASLAVCAFQIPVPELLKIATLIKSTIKPFKRIPNNIPSPLILSIL